MVHGQAPTKLEERLTRPIHELIQDGPPGSVSDRAINVHMTHGMQAQDCASTPAGRCAPRSAPHARAARGREGPEHRFQRHTGAGRGIPGPVGSVVRPDRTDQITMLVERSVLACFQAPGKGYRTRMNRVLESTVRHIAKQSAVASGRSLRSEANFCLRECRPRPHLGSSPASLSAFFHQSPASERLMRGNRSFVAGITAASPIFSCLPPAGLSGASGRCRTTATDGSPPCGAPSRGLARAHAALRPARGGSRVTTPNATDTSAPPRRSASSGGRSGSPGNSRRGGWWPRIVEPHRARRYAARSVIFGC